MLQKSAVEASTLELIRRLQNDEKLAGFYLAGGTALALFLGHRRSVDIDLFTLEDFDTPYLLEHLEHLYGFSLQYITQNTLKGTISGIFVDLITHNYPLITDIISEEGISMYSEKDIAAMKVNAITGNGTRLKDFIDIYYLLEKFTAEELLSFYTAKYDLQNKFHAVKSLIYFGDLDPEPVWPVMLKEKKLSLEKIKKTIETEIKRYLEIES